MQIDPQFTEIVLTEEVMKETNGAIGTLPNVHTFINKVIDLCGY